MQDLERVRKDTADIAKESESEYKKTVRRHTKTVMIIVVAVIAALAGLFIYSVVNNKLSEAKRASEIKEEIEFRNAYFAELDEIYETGSDEELADRIDELQAEKGSGALFDWKHYKYYICYREYQSLKLTRENIASGNYIDEDLRMGLFSSLSLLYDDYYAVDEKSESPEKLAVIEKAHEEAHAFICDDLGYGPEEEQELLEKCSDSGYVSYSMIDKVLPEIKEHMEKSN